jgi:hypothetical protein
MTLTDGTTTLTFTGTQVDDALELSQSRTTTAGGNDRIVRPGKRFIIEERVRLTGSEYGSLMTLLLSGAENYQYTPTIVPDYFTASDFPMKVSIDIPRKEGQAGGGGKKYYVSLRMRSSSYV